MCTSPSFWRMNFPRGCIVQVILDFNWKFIIPGLILFFVLASCLYPGIWLSKNWRRQVFVRLSRCFKTVSYFKSLYSLSQFQAIFLEMITFPKTFHRLFFSMILSPHASTAVFITLCWCYGWLCEPTAAYNKISCHDHKGNWENLLKTKFHCCENHQKEICKSFRNCEI